MNELHDQLLTLETSDDVQAAMRSGFHSLLSVFCA
jgi:hypothetical protein